MKKLLFIFIISLFFLAGEARAAELSMSIPDNVKAGEVFSVGINATTGGEIINSADIIIDYPERLLTFEGYKNTDAAIRFWVEPPEDKNGKISMSGIIPGGVLGLYDARREGLRPVPLVELTFKAKDEGTGEFTYGETRLLLHDGKGTELSHEKAGGTIRVVGTMPLEENNEGKIDGTPPEPFDVVFIEAVAASRTPSMIIFQANDVGSGIEGYQVKIGARDWKKATSPYIVRKGIFSEEVIVRATDFYGNYRDSSVNVPGLVSYRLILTVLGALICGFLVFKLIKYRL